MPTIIRHKNHPNRLDALARGETTFVFPCVANPDHKTRYTSSGTCVACSAGRSARRDAALKAARPPRPAVQVATPRPTRKKQTAPDHRRHRSAAENIRRAELAEQRVRETYGSDVFKKKKFFGFGHMSPADLDRSRRLTDDIVRAGKNLIR